MAQMDTKPDPTLLQRDLGEQVRRLRLERGLCLTPVSIPLWRKRIVSSVPTTTGPLATLECFTREAVEHMGICPDDGAILTDVLLSGSLRVLPGQGYAMIIRLKRQSRL